MSYYVQQLTPVYYDTLINWDLIDEIISHLEEHEHAEAYQTIFHTLDCVVLDTVMHHLHQDHHHQFLLLCTHQHHEASLLSWLQERSQGIDDQIKDRLLAAKYQLLKEFSQE